MRSAFKVLAGLAIASFASVASATVFNGNAATGFGGPLGNGNLSVTESAGVLTFTLNPAGSNFGGNHVVLYLDTVAGGISSTAGLTDEQDGGRRNISGVFTNNPNNGGTTNRSTVQFGSGFAADYAISFETGSFAGIFNLSNASNFGFVGGNGIANDGPYTVTVNRSDLGLGAASSFNFVGSLVAGSIYRSNETLGTSVTTPGSGGDAPNAGFNGTVTFTNSLTYSVPEPASLGLIGLAGLGLAARRRRA